MSENSETECWTPREAASIWSYQLECSPKYICPNAGDGKHSDHYGDLSCLLATQHGWSCLACDYRSTEVSDEAKNYRKDELDWMNNLTVVEEIGS